ncbi:dihydrofolate reductase family protein [Shewanella abyssi]|uniref:dihydrofolate reductase family protein n=1 Tax=Shewanella abyssi TaxID=311789 RepID=UPI00200E60B0|nr:dihydrofolate reductase family protein [Shewanella abyssi]MCL1048472.1 dihydrofolate reductase family protein [Shewanella abyssi]
MKSSAIKCSVYIATSADGYIATTDGGVDWLHTAGNTDADMGDEDMGFWAFMNSVDCMVMGRKCMEMISSMDLTPAQWVYGDMPIIVLSKTVKQPPENMLGKVEMYAGEIEALMQDFAARGLKHAYIDGGSTITSFLNLKLINQMIITKVPLLLGEGIPLFGKIDHVVKLTDAQSEAYVNDFVQVRYNVSYEQ